MKREPMGRRTFLGASAAALTGLTFGPSLFAVTPSAEAEPNLKKALKIGMLPKDLSDADQFALAKRCGFDGIDAIPLEDPAAARAQARLARQMGVPIHGVVFGGWHALLSDPDPDVARRGIDGMENALRCAHEMDADTVLLVPAVVNEKVGYADAYRRSQDNIRKLVPLAKELGVIIAIENVWNKFLLSPLEFARYLDEFESPWVRAYFDVGNVIIHGYAEDWIRTLGARIVKLDLKDFRREGYEWTNLGDGDVNWPEVRRALKEIGFNGWMTAELKRGDEAYLTDVADRIDRLLIS